MQEAKSDRLHRTSAIRTLASKSSSSSSSQPPKLSPRNYRDLVILLTGATGSWLYLRNSDWDADVAAARQALLVSATTATTTTSDPDEPVSGLPPPLQRYLDKVQQSCNGHSDGQSSTIQSLFLLQVTQSGSFWASQQWYPFTAKYLTTARSLTASSSPGFVWEAQTTILGMPNMILESLVNGTGSIVTKAWGRLPLIQVVEEEPFLLFWLAMAPLTPNTTFSASTTTTNNSISNSISSTDSNYGHGDTYFEWKNVHDLSTCSGQLIHRNVRNGKEEKDVFYTELQFDPQTNLLTSIRVTSSPSLLPIPWQVNYSDYQPIGSANMLIPCTIEVGKWQGSYEDDNNFQSHLKLQNHSVEMQGRDQ